MERELFSTKRKKQHPLKPYLQEEEETASSNCRELEAIVAGPCEQRGSDWSGTRALTSMDDR